MQALGNNLRLSTRLLVTYAMLLSATVFVVAGIVVLLTRGFITGELDDELSSTVESFKRNAASDISAPEELTARTRLWLERGAFPADEVVAVRTADGRVFSSTGILDLEELPDARSLLETTTARWWRIEASDGTPVRVLSVPILLDGQQIGTVAAMASQARANETLSALLSGIAWAAVIGLVLSGLVGLAVIRRTLRPLERMTTDVTSIQDTGDLSQRVGGAGLNDEVGRLAEAFNKMLSRLQETFSSHRRFLSDASHELRTPLTVARGQLELIEPDRRANNENRSLTVAVEELDRMGRIVDELLLLARLDEGMTLQREPVEIELVVREALLRGMHIERRHVAVDIEPDLFVLADEDRLLQVLTNLVTNAVLHTGQDASVAVSARPDGDNVAIQVADTGPGIPPEDLPHVFERLYRGSRATSAAPSGAGLGLPIAASLVAAMGGDISVSSGSAGTTFTISMPRADVPELTPVPR